MTCPYDCYTCFADGRCDSCNATHDFRQLDSATSRCVPLPGYYDVSVTVSVQCSSGCSVCSNTSFCLQCFSGFFMRGDNQCYSTCLERFFPNNSTFSCDSCPYDCLTCNSNGGCSSCSGSVDFRQLNYTNSRCIPLDGYF